MELQGRNLNIRMRGQEVELLQQELCQLGFAIEDKAGYFGRTTRQVVEHFQEQQGLEMTGVVDERTAMLINRAIEALQPDTDPNDAGRLLVKGHILNPDGRSETGIFVKAFDKSVRGETLLGTATTSPDGAYSINYTTDQLSSPGKTQADLIVRAFDDENTEIAASSLILEASNEQVVDLIVGNEPYCGPSEFDRLRSTLEPLLEDLDPFTLTEEQIVYLARKSRFDPVHVAYFIRAAILRQTIDSEAAIFYGLFRQNLPVELSDLLRHPPETLQDALTTAAAENLVPIQFSKLEHIEQLFENGRQWLVKQAFAPRVEVGKHSLGDLIATTLETSEQQEMFLAAYVCHQGPMKDFWEGLKEDATFAGQAAELQLTVQLGAITGNHLPLVSEILRLVRTRQPVKHNQTITNLKDLTVFNETDWQMLVQEEDVGLPPNLPGESTAEKQQIFARAITRMLEDTYPTAFIANRIADDGQLEGGQDLLTFFTNNPKFELTITRLATYVADNPNALNSITDKDLVQDKIQTMHRIYKLAPDYTAMKQIMEAGIDSAQAINTMGPTVFTAKFGKMLATQNLDAMVVYEGAQQTAATALALLGAYGMGASKLPLFAVPDQSLGSLPQIPGIPDWQTLFGSLELCECKHCRSVYSPAAYLVDTLHFLKDRHLVDQITRDPATGRIKKVTYKKKILANGKQVDKSAKDVLFARRPDLGVIELTCDNTNTPLPYIDLVNEILENLVAPLPAFTPFSLTATFEKYLNQGQVSKKLRNAFQTANQILSPHATLTVKTQGSWWRVDDLACTYTIQKDAQGQIRVNARSLQTIGSTLERAATPQYVNPEAYTKLKKQVFPWSLPFDLCLKESRAYLKHLGVSRVDLMETFLPGKRTDLLARTDLAHEALGLTPESADLINGKTSPAAGAWTLWGFNAETLSPQNAIPDPADNSKWIQNGHWLTAVLTQRLDVFLQQSDLKYIELLNLLETHYINPLSGGQRKITISSTIKNPATCELAKLKLNGFDQTDAAKVVRFMRLGRNTDWNMSELDQAITVLHPRNQIGGLLTQPADINQLMVRLTHVKRLETLLELSVNALLGFWISLTDKKLQLSFWTDTYTDYSTKSQAENPSRYTQLFRNKTVTTTLDKDFPENAALLDQTKQLSGNSVTITAALGISSTDFTLLLQAPLVIPRVPDPTDTTKMIPDDRLKLAYLTRLQRHAVLAKALKLKIPEYLSILNLLGDPFLTTCTSVRFVERTQKLLGSGFTIDELDYLLQHKFIASAAIAPTEAAIALDLNEIRTALQQIAAENTFIEKKTVDLVGELTGKKLALLNWNNSLISQVIATFNDTLTYETALQTFPQGVELPNDTGSYEVDLPANALPVNFAVPQSIKDIVLYDKTSQRLRATRALTQAETKLLANVPGAAASNVYQLAVAALAELPAQLHGRINYDAAKKKLYFTGAMSINRQTKLKKVPAGQDYLKALDKLFWAPRLFILRQMRTYKLETFSTGLATLPVGMTWPAPFKQRIYFDAGAKKLCFVGAMSASEQTTLRTLTHKENKPKVVQNYQQAIDTLFIAADTPPAAKDTFLSAPNPSAAVYNQNTDAGRIFDNPTTPGDRYVYVLKRILPYLCNSLSDFIIKQKLGQALKLEAKAIDGLLTKWIQARINPGKKCIRDFRGDDFAKSNLKVKLTRKIFPDQFDTYTLLYKIALIITRLKVTSRQLTWIFAYGSKADWLDFNTLPLAATSPAPAPIDAWERLISLFQLRDTLPLSESVLDKLFQTAHKKNTAKEAYLDLLANETRWMVADIETLVGKKSDQQDKGALELQFPDDYLGERALTRLHTAFTKLKRVGVSAALCHKIAAKQVDQQTARSIIQAVKAKYDDQQWLKLAKPLRDELRGKQRTALMAYLVKHPLTIKLAGGATQPAWRNVNGLYAHVLIDTEMSPCQLTSRIKQANSSVQLFVQRCRMNLERDVNANAEVDINWKQWQWMKNYRVWEANRKIFLYPENWIEPELRADKSPFFKGLETALLQNELTEENTEKAFLSYLEKLDGVASLEIVGMYHQLETDDGTADGKTIIDVLHVFGRTHNTPHFYYYRQRVDSAYWTAWTKLDQDIQGDHLLPVVWNRRLYLFWPLFTKKQLKKPVTMPTDKKPLKEGAVYWEIQLQWSEYKQGTWSAKSISDEAVISMLKPVEEIKDLGKHRHILRAMSTKEGLLIRYGFGANAFTHDGKTLWDIDKEKDKNFLKTFFRAFLFDGCQNKVVIDYYWGLPKIIAPQGTEAKGMLFVEKSESALYLPAVHKPSSTLAALATTPGPEPFRLLYPHQDKSLTGKRPLFFQDTDRTFFIERQFERTPVYLLAPNWIERQEIDISTFEGLLKKYLDKLMKKPGLVPPIPTGNNGFTPSYPIIEESQIEPITAHTIDSNLLPADTGEVILPNAGVDTVPGGNLWHDFYENIPLNEVLHPAPEPFGWMLEERYRFYSFYHPYVCSFIRHLNRDGLNGMLQRPVQRQLKRFFAENKQGYAPTDIVMKGLPTKDEKYPKYPKEEVDFSYGGAFAQYNWELFFHAPLLIAERLNKDQRFEKAQQWFHYIFDPTDASSEDVPRRYWRTKPFFETTDEKYQRERVPNLLRFLANRGDATLLKALTTSEFTLLEELEQQVRDWRKDPFKPHLVARMRTTAYQKTVVMKYIDNLIDWGDQLFRRDTMESLNEATQLYILAAEILGDRPESMPPRAVPQVQTFNSLEPALDEFSGALVLLEEFVPPSTGPAKLPSTVQAPLPKMLYFCVPKNDQLLGYWDTIADRLFKIRHCMNIKGVERQLPLFAPPIDPGLLVKAAAAGIDISSALNDINPALPHYRFRVMSQKASELVGEVKSLGGALLSVLEKRDAEALSLLRSTHELQVLSAVRLVKKKQIEDTKETLAGLNAYEVVIQTRAKHYQNLGSENIKDGEQEQLDKLDIVENLQIAQQVFEYIAAVLHVLPMAKVGSPTTAGYSFGGRSVAAASQSIAGGLGLTAAMLNTQGTMTVTKAGYQRRAEEWAHQQDLATKEIAQVKKQIAAAEIRQAIAEQELRNHDLQVKNTKQVDAYMGDKFTNRELYDWMIGQISSIYFQSYQLAYDLAKRTEQAYRYELGLNNSGFIQFGYWDSLKKGLLAGERLNHDIKRMEVAYLDQHQREYEITRHISLAELDAMALVQLKQTGTCYVSLPEALFDLDYPGHYLRRIKSVGITIPCITGPYTSVSCTLTQLKSVIRHSNHLNGGSYKRKDNDTRFIDKSGAMQTIVTSNGQDDNGLFEDNLRDERYLPFEGAGAISEWRLELPDEFRQFDYDTIADVILHLRYTAREGGGRLKQQAIKELHTGINQLVLSQSRKGLHRLFGAKHEFSNAWHRFLHPRDTDTTQTLKLDLDQSRFSSLFKDTTITIKTMHLFIKLKNRYTYLDGAPLTFDLKSNGGSYIGKQFQVAGSPVRNLAYAKPFENQSLKVGEWSIEVHADDLTDLSSELCEDVQIGNLTIKRLKPDAFEDFIMVCRYTVEKK